MGAARGLGEGGGGSDGTAGWQGRLVQARAGGGVRVGPKQIGGGGQQGKGTLNGE